MSQIVTNNVPRPIVNYYDVPEKVRESEFDYLDEGEGSFFKYKNVWYDLGEFVVSNVDGWDGVHTETMFSGILVKLANEDEVIVGSMFA